MVEVTHLIVECSTAREILSAHLDNEALSEEAALGERHLAACDGCQAWWSAVVDLNRRIRIRTAEAMPDLAPAVLLRAHPPSPGRRHWVRYALALVAVGELALALPGLLAGQGSASVHDARHVGSFGAAVAVGLLYVAWRPGRAFGILPLISTLAITMFVAAMIDLTRGSVSRAGEATHLLEIAGLWLVWRLAGQPLPPRLRAPRDQDDTRPTHLRAL